MNKRQRKKYQHKQAVKFTDGYGLMPIIYGNPFVGKTFNSYKSYLKYKHETN
jgi:hypothetical protein